jgi:hypothetical protein
MVASRRPWLTIGTLVLMWSDGTSWVSGVSHTPDLNAVVAPGAILALSEQDDPAYARTRHAYGQLPLHFEANRGQTDPQVDFLARGPGYTVFLTPNQTIFSLSSESPRARQWERPGKTLGSQRTGEPQQPAVLRMMLIGANPRAKVAAMKQLAGNVNYLRGNDPSRWRTDIPTYAEVTYKDVYPKIDVVYYGNQRELEYDFLLYPGSSPDAIRLRFDGADRIGIDDHGDLLLHTTVGVVRESKPRIYQTIEGGQQPIPGRYVLLSPSLVSFAVGEYDLARPLVIDPTLVYSTYLGRGGRDRGSAIAVDASGNAYVTGHTESVEFPTDSGTFDATFNGGFEDVFVTKVDASGSGFVYSTYLGGTDADAGWGIAVDGLGSAYVIGTTGSVDFPTGSGAFDAIFNGAGDVFVTKLDADGSAVLYSTYVGGSHIDHGRAIAVDAAGNAYVTGATLSADFPMTAGAFDTSFSGHFDAFVTKLNAAGSAIVYSTYLAGTPADPLPPEAVGAFGHGIALDVAGNAYVTGPTDSPDFPTTAGAFDTTFDGAIDTFVTKLDAAGATLAYSTYLGGSSEDHAQAIAVDAAGHAYVTGFTSADFPTTPGAFATTLKGLADAFVTKLNPVGSALVYSTYLGGISSDLPSGIAVDVSGIAYVTGTTISPDFPTTQRRSIPASTASSPSPRTPSLRSSMRPARCFCMRLISAAPTLTPVKELQSTPQATRT